jgi:Protein of unknown function (DUF2516)
MSSLLFPLDGAIFVISLAIRVLVLVALIDVIIRPTAAFVAAGKQTKWLWLIFMVIGLFIPLVGVIAGIVYLVDVRPAVRGVGGGGPPRSSSSDGPYGPYRR